MSRLSESIRSSRPAVMASAIILSLVLLLTPTPGHTVEEVPDRTLQNFYFALLFGLGNSHIDFKRRSPEWDPGGSLETRASLAQLSLIMFFSPVLIQRILGYSGAASASTASANKGKLFFEIGYTDLGDFDFNGTWLGTTDIGSENASLIKASIGYSHPINKKMSVLGKVGVSRWKNEVDEIFGGVPESSSMSGNDAHFGLGLSYKLNNSWGLRFEWERHKNIANADDVDAITFNVLYNFGAR